MKNPNDIALPTLEEIKGYHEGSLTDARSREIEMLALEHPLVADALEGFAEIPAYGSVPESLLLQSKSWLWRLSGWFSAGVAVVAIGVAVYLQRFEEPSGPVKAISPDTAALEAQGRQAELTQPQAVSKWEGTVKQKTQTSSNKTQQQAPKADSARAGEPVAALKPRQIGVVSSAQATNDSPEFWPSYTEDDGVVLKHIKNYKVVDYGAMRHDHWKPIEPVLEGTPASEAGPKQVQELQDQPLHIPYLRFIQTCIEAYYDGQTKRCLQHFATVLEQYPDDVNAQFYSAMCFFNRGEYANALRYYDMSLANETRSFGEESLYYKAMSLKKLGKSSEACKLFTYIRDAKGYYAAKASQALAGCTAE